MNNVPGVGVTSHRLSRFTAPAPATRSCPASGDWIEPILARSQSKYRSLHGGSSSSDPLRMPIRLRDDQRRRRAVATAPLAVLQSGLTLMPAPMIGRPLIGSIIDCESLSGAGSWSGQPTTARARPLGKRSPRDREKCCLHQLPPQHSEGAGHDRPFPAHAKTRPPRSGSRAPVDTDYSDVMATHTVLRSRLAPRLAPRSARDRYMPRREVVPGRGYSTGVMSPVTTR
jgi:hypothetical protein